MNRRNFLAGLGALVGGIAIEQAIPLNRVWSFPRQIVIHKAADEASMILPFASITNYLDIIWYDRRAIDLLKRNVGFSE